jgi:hypothetical protein
MGSSSGTGTVLISLSPTPTEEITGPDLPPRSFARRTTGAIRSYPFPDQGLPCVNNNETLKISVLKAKVVHLGGGPALIIKK